MVVADSKLGSVLGVKNMTWTLPAYIFRIGSDVSALTKSRFVMKFAKMVAHSAVAPSVALRMASLTWTGIFALLSPLLFE